MNKSIYLDFIAKQKGHVPIVVYVAIGCAAHRVVKDSDKLILPQENNQEYPKFLQTLKNKFPDANLHIFMIDPDIEKPPFVITTGDKIQDKLTLKENWIRVNDELFYNQQENTTIYAISEYISYPYSENIYGVKYDIFFNKLNNYAIENKWTVFVCDYTGTRIGKFAEYYEKTLENNLDHIIYEFIADDDSISTCMIDTTAIECQFVYEIKNNVIKIFNPYAFEKDYHISLPNYLQTLKINSDWQIASNQIKIFLKNKKSIIRNILFATMRNVRICLIKKENINDWYAQNFKYLNTKYDINKKIKFDTQKFDEKEYTDLYNILKNICTEELKIYISIVYHDESNDIIEERFKNMMTEQDPYQWDKYVNDLYINYNNFF